jgi:hypothetical protein
MMNAEQFTISIIRKLMNFISNLLALSSLSIEGLIFISLHLRFAWWWRKLRQGIVCQVEIITNKIFLTFSFINLVNLVFFRVILNVH